MKKILAVNHSFFPISETFIYNQVLALSSAYTVDLLGSSFINEELFVLENKKHLFKYHYGVFDGMVSTVLKNVLCNKERLSPAAHNKIRKLMEKEGIDYVHAHFGYMGLRILPVAKTLNIPLIVSFHGLDASPESLNQGDYRKNLKKLFDYASGIIIVSSHMFRSLDLGPYQEKVHFIPYGVDTDKFRKAPVIKKERTIRILHVGRLVEKKGVPDLISVFLKIYHQYDIRLDIIGDGPERERCQALIAGHADKQVPIELWGAKPHDFILQMLHAADIFVLNSRVSPSGDMEGLPNVILEAMSMGLPVLSTYHAGIPDLIQSGENGVLVDEYDNTQLMEALIRLIEEEDKRERLGSKARQTVVETHALHLMGKRLRDVFLL